MSDYLWSRFILWNDYQVWVLEFPLKRTMAPLFIGRNLAHAVVLTKITSYERSDVTKTSPIEHEFLTNFLTCSGKFSEEFVQFKPSQSYSLLENKFSIGRIW